ncbi:MAG: transcriptional regulator-like protein [Bacilli bacterium]|nr:transcriptional regulator-like protein [Bacilli bacterium]
MNEHKNLLQLENVLMQLMRILTSEWKKYCEGEFTRSEIMILEQLAFHGKQHVTNLSESSMITPGGITGICDKLVNKRLIGRIRDEGDRRVVFLEITDQGREELQKVILIRKKFMGDFYGSLSEEDINHLIRIYNELLHTSQNKQKEQ